MKVIAQNVLKTKVMDWNAAYYGVDIYDWMDKAGRGIARALNSKFETRNSKLKIGIFCGLGNNGGDGFAAAKYLYKKHDVKVFLFGSPLKINTPESRRTWDEMLAKGIDTQVIKSARDIKSVDKSFDIVLDCFLGTGVSGKLREPIASGVKQFNKLTAKQRTKGVAVDFPTKGVQNIDLVISMQFPKTEGAEVVDLQSDPRFLSKIGLGEFRALKFSKAGAHKGQSGRLLVIAGNEQYHGAFLYSIKTASKIVDLVYFLSSAMNEKLAEKLREKTAEYIPVEKIEKNIDCIMVGPGVGKEKWTLDLAIKALKTKKKIVLDADVLEPEILKHLHSKVILTPHKAEFDRTFGVKSKGISSFAKASEEAAKAAKKYNCTIVLKGKVDMVANPDWGLKYNYTGNVGMTKGGTGDVLTALISSFYCLTDDPYIAAAAGTFVNGLAGDALYERVNRFYDAEDLIIQLPGTLNRLTNYKK